MSFPHQIDHIKNTIYSMCDQTHQIKHNPINNFELFEIQSWAITNGGVEKKKKTSSLCVI